MSVVMFKINHHGGRDLMPQMSANQTQIQTLPVALVTITLATTSTISITRLTNTIIIISSLIPHPPCYHQKVAVRIADEVAFAVASFPDVP